MFIVTLVNHQEIPGGHTNPLEKTVQANTITVAAAVLLLTTTPVAASDAERAGADEVVAKVRQAAALIEKEGDAAFITLKDPTSDYVWKDTYVFVVNCDADRVMANPAFPERVGGDIKQHADYSGKPYGLELCRTAAKAGGGWIEYFWLVPGGDTPKRKVSFVMSVPGAPYQVGAGIYDATVSVADLNRKLRSFDR